MRGQFELTIYGNILFTRVKGEWNQIIAERFDVEFRNKIESLKNSDWAHIIHLEEWMLGTPKFEPVIKKLGTWCYFNNVAATALVYQKHVLKDFQVNNLGFHRQDGIEVEQFEHVNDALKSLSSLGFMNKEFGEKYNAL